jgi:pimeloyl-ACP methyl ester carboxylesterase
MKSYDHIHDNKKISIQESGEGDTALLLLHGNSCSKEIWSPFFQNSLKEHFQLVAFDFPGHGESERPNNPKVTYTLKGLADSVVNVLSRISSKSVILIGNSLGGHVAIQAMGRIENLKAVVVCGTPPLGIPPALQEAFLPHPLAGLFFTANVDEAQVRELFQSLFVKRSVPEDQIKTFLKTDPAFREHILASVLNGNGVNDEITTLAKTAVPTLLLHAMEDAFVNSEYVQKIAAQANSEVSTVEGGHMLPLDNPDGMINALKLFLKNVH